MTSLFVVGLALLASVAAFSKEQIHAKSALFTLSKDWIPCGKAPYRDDTEPDPVTPLKLAAGPGPKLTLHNEMPANAVPMRYGGPGDTDPHLDVHIPVCPQGAAVKGYIWVSYRLASREDESP